MSVIFPSSTFILYLFRIKCHSFPLFLNLWHARKLANIASPWPTTAISLEPTIVQKHRILTLYSPRRRPTTEPLLLQCLSSIIFSELSSSARPEAVTTASAGAVTGCCPHKDSPDGTVRSAHLLCHPAPALPKTSSFKACLSCAQWTADLMWQVRGGFMGPRQPCWQRWPGDLLQVLLGHRRTLNSIYRRAFPMSFSLYVLTLCWPRRDCPSGSANS